MVLNEESADLRMWVRASVLEAKQSGQRFSSARELLVAGCERCVHWPSVTLDDVAYVTEQWEVFEQFLRDAPRARGHKAQEQAHEEERARKQATADVHYQRLLDAEERARSYDREKARTERVVPVSPEANTLPTKDSHDLRACVRVLVEDAERNGYTFNNAHDLLLAAARLRLGRTGSGVPATRMDAAYVDLAFAALRKSQAEPPPVDAPVPARSPVAAPPVGKTAEYVFVGVVMAVIIGIAGVIAGPATAAFGVCVAVGSWLYDKATNKDS